jgi:hypothetical protein
VCPTPGLIFGENHIPLNVQLVVLLVYKVSFSGVRAKLSLALASNFSSY